MEKSSASIVLMLHPSKMAWWKLMANSNSPVPRSNTKQRISGGRVNSNAFHFSSSIHAANPCPCSSAERCRRSLI
jgi:hypothetical protein